MPRWPWCPQKPDRLLRRGTSVLSCKSQYGMWDNKGCEYPRTWALPVESNAGRSTRDNHTDSREKNTVRARIACVTCVQHVYILHGTMVYRRVTEDDESYSGTNPDARDTSGANDQRNPMPWLDLDDSLTGVDDRHPDATRDDHPSDEWVSVSRTGFKPSDADGREDYWQWLERLHDGYGTYGTRSSALHEMGVARDLDMIADRLGATELQHDQAQYLIDNIDVKAEVLQSGPIEAAVIAVISLVIDGERTERANIEADQIPQSVTRDEAYNTVLESYDLEPSDIHTVRKKVRETDVWKRQRSVGA